MAEVFISYKREDRRYAEALHSFLTRRGFSAWWDTRLIAGENFNAAVQRELDAARCVVVLWTRASHASQWVQAEALTAFDRKVLVSARLDDVKLDYPFGVVQTADLRAWDGGLEDPRLEQVLEGVELKVGRRARLTPLPAPTPKAPSPSAAPSRSPSLDVVAGLAFRAGALRLHWRKLAAAGFILAAAIGVGAAWKAGAFGGFGGPAVAAAQVPASRIYGSDLSAIALATDTAATFRPVSTDWTGLAAQPFIRQARSMMVQQYGEGLTRTGGMTIHVTMDPRLQLLAARALFAGLEAYDRRHAWRGPVAHGDAAHDALNQLLASAAPPVLTDWLRAMVMSSDGGVQLLDERGDEGPLQSDDVRWASARAPGGANGLDAGAIVYVRREGNRGFRLQQAPEVQGALIAMDPASGGVLALIGGADVRVDDGARATRDNRQPGSAMLPIVYAAALENGATPATLVADAPIAIAGESGVSFDAYDTEFLGPTTLRRGFELSRNTMTLRLASELGAKRVAEYARQLGVYDETYDSLNLALGDRPTSLMRLTAAYATFANGGKRVRPVLFEYIQDAIGRTIFRRDQRACEGCNAAWASGLETPLLPDTRDQVVDPVTAYQIVSLAAGAVQRGTASLANTDNGPVGGKAGNSPGGKGAWFIGFSPELAVGVWVGFDDGRALGDGETGERLAAPIFSAFVAEAQADALPNYFTIPPGVRLVRVDGTTGRLPGATTDNVVLESFRPGTEPTYDSGATSGASGAP